jgi:hypothetical protein
MIIVDLLPSITELVTTVLVNKIERGNIVLLFPAVLAACWIGRVRLRNRQRRWLRLSSAEQLRRQQLANMTGRRNELYPL